MEKKILEIIDRVEYARRHKYLPPADRQKIMAVEIADHFREFIEWIRRNADGEGTNEWYIGDENIYTLDELFQYWLDNIKKDESNNNRK